jgi:putative copper export protein
MISFFHVIPEWVELVSLAFCIGALVCRLWVLAPSASPELPDQENLLALMWRLFGIGIAAMIASSVVNLLMRASEISGRPLSDVFSVLPVVMFRTHLGRVFLVRIGVLILLLLTLMAAGRYRNSRGLPAFMLCIALVISMTESASGHASDKGDFSIPEITDWLHLMASSVWGGGLLVLSVVILPALVGKGNRTAADIADVARRFSGIAGFAVGVVGITALYNSLVYVGSFGAFWKTSYGWAASAKIFLFLLILYLGAFNRYVSVPLLQECACISSDRQGVIERIAVHFFPRYLCTEDKSLIAVRFKWSVKVEALLIIGILFCAAYLRHEVPARHVSHLEHGGEKGHSMQHHDGDGMDTHPDHKNQRQ